MVPGARIELATPAFSGRRSTTELPRLFLLSKLYGPSPFVSIQVRGYSEFLLPCAPCLARLRRRHHDVENNRFAAVLLHFWYFA
jgi:hypothetical protein